MNSQKKTLGTFVVPIILLSVPFGHFNIATGEKQILIYYSDILIFIFANIFLSTFLIRNKVGSRLNLPFETYELKLLLWLLLILISSTIIGLVQGDVLWTRGLVALKVFLMGFLVYFVSVASLRNYSDIRTAVSALILLAFFMAVSIIFLPLWRTVSYAEMLEYKYRVATPVGHSNYLGAFLGILVPFIVFGIAVSRKAARSMHIGNLILTCAALMFTQSKTAFFGIILMSAVYIVFIYQGMIEQKTKLITFTFFVVLLLTFMNYDLISGIYNKTITSFRELQVISIASLQKGDVGDTLISRIYLWKVGLKLFTEHPVVGAGLSSASIVLDDIFNTNWLGVHNLIVELLAETGIIGTLLFCLLLYNIYSKIKKLRIKITSSTNEAKGTKLAMAHFLSLAFLVAIVNSLLEPTILSSSYSVVFWVVCGIIHVLYVNDYPEAEETSMHEKVSI